MRMLSIMAMLFISMFFCSCSARDRTMFFDGGEKSADARMEQIVSAIKNKDREALKSMFSEKALEEDADIDRGIDYLFDLFQGDMDSWERDGMAASGNIENGKESKMNRFALVNNGIYEYSLFIIDYYIDTINPKNEGVYMLEIIRTADMNNLKSWQERLQAGIKKPEE